MLAQLRKIAPELHVSVERPGRGRITIYMCNNIGLVMALRIIIDVICIVSSNIHSNVNAS